MAFRLRIHAAPGQPEFFGLTVGNGTRSQQVKMNAAPAVIVKNELRRANLQANICRRLPAGAEGTDRGGCVGAVTAVAAGEHKR
ncbi:hypothetical protein D6029_13350 [Buttiauxella izardii]|uniref:Uncharacterized protein n=1 Tax=Buttiauxella izardii TaxID=82991 RepID=A0A3A5JWI9_9ENTR|nr:hypothetical protein D6029_13350 [Buttiauxella izardii]